MKTREFLQNLKGKPQYLSLTYFSLFSLFTIFIVKFKFLKSIDEALAKPIRPFYTPLRYYTLMISDNYGLRWVTLLAPLLASLYIYYKKENLKPFILTLLAFILDNGLTGVIKYLLNRSKPSSLHSKFFTENYHSYPSGHLVNIILIYSLTLYLLKKYTDLDFNRLKIYYYFNTFMATSFFITSLMRNTHWLTDLIGSLLLSPAIFYLLSYIDSKIIIRIRK
jgi:membrane-associated phospholipid phosphatase